MQTPIIPHTPHAEPHFSEAEVARYAHARARGMEPFLTQEQTEHLEDCPHCQQAIMHAFTLLADTPLAHIPSIEDTPLSPRKTIWRRLLPPHLMRVAAVFLLGFMLLTVYWITSPPILQATKKWQSPFENKEIDVAYQGWTIQGTESKTIYLSNGSYVRIPAGAFLNAQGEEVSGNINIQYREMRSLSDLLSSGVPTQYDSMQVKHTLAMLGIFELQAWQNGKPLQLATNKVLEVNMLTSDASNDYAHYHLEEKTNQLAYQIPFSTPAYASPQDAKWQYLGASQMRCDSLPNLSPIVLLENKRQEIQALERDLQQIEEEEKEKGQKQTIRPREISQQTNKLFSLKLNEEEHPGLARYHSTIWEYAGENPKLNPAETQGWVLQEKWDEVRLKEQSFRSLSLIGHNGAVRSAVFSPDGRHILTASDDHTARIWTNKAQHIATLHGHSDAVNSAVYSPNGQYIVTVSSDNTAMIWSEKGDKLFALLGHLAPIKSVSFNKSGDYILTTSLDNTAKLWNLQGANIASFAHDVPAFEAQFAPDGKSVLVIPTQNSAEIWSITGDKIRSIKGYFGTARFAVSGDFILTTSRNNYSGKAIIWATKTGKALRELDLNDTDAMFTPDEGHIFSLTGANPRIWHWNKLKPNSTVLIANMRHNANEKREGHTKKIRKSTFSPNGEWIMTAGEDNMACVWTKRGNLIRTLREHTAPINTVEVSMDGKTFVTASDDHTAKLWRERETQDVLELILVKNDRKLLDNKGQRYEIKGKEVHVPVRLKGEQAETNQDFEMLVIGKRQTEPENTLLERYEHALAECKALEQLPKQNTNQLCFRQFRIRSMGVYACAKAIQNKSIETYTLKLESKIPNQSLHLYRVAQIGGAYMIQRVEKKPEIQLAKKELLIVIFPKDRLALYQQEHLPANCQPPAKACKLHLQAQAQVLGKVELDRVMR